MSKAGESILRGARQALAFARGEADAKDFRVDIPAEIEMRRIGNRPPTSATIFCCSP